MVMEGLMAVLSGAFAIGALLLFGARCNRQETPALTQVDIDTFDAMSAVPHEIWTEIEAKVAEEYPRTASVVDTADALTELVTEKLPGWPWAAFVSVLVQRREAVRDRVLDSRLGFAVPTSESARSDGAVARFVVDRMSELMTQLDQLEEVMHSAGFRNVLGAMADDDDADSGDILHTANRLMDVHDRFLELAERCRGVNLPSRHVPLLNDCARLAGVPLDGYQKFIDDFTALVAKVPGWLYYSDGDIDAGQVVLDIDMDDDELRERIFGQVRQLMNR